MFRRLRAVPVRYLLRLAPICSDGRDLAAAEDVRVRGRSDGRPDDREGGHHYETGWIGEWRKSIICWYGNRSTVGGMLVVR